MKVELESRCVLGDKVDFFLKKTEWQKGVVYKVKWEPSEREFVYLIEKDNEERFWVPESRVIKEHIG